MSAHSVSLAQAETTKQLIAGIWRKNRSLVLARLEVLERTATAIERGTLTPILLEEALLISHTLAGALGMFGFGQGTLLARVLEQQLENAAPNGGLMLATINDMREVLFPDSLSGSSSSIASN